MDRDARRLTDAEVAEVLARATDLPPEPEGGLSVEELRAVAAEVGIPSEALSEALRQVSRSSAADNTSVRRWLQQRDTAFVPVSVSDTELAMLLKLLDGLGHIRGEVSYDQGTVRWRASDGHRVEVLCRPSETQVTVEADFRPSVLSVLGGTAWVFVAVTVAARMLLDPELIMLGAAGALASYGAYLKYRAERLREKGVKTLAGIKETLLLVTRDRGGHE